MLVHVGIEVSARDAWVRGYVVALHVSTCDAAKESSAGRSISVTVERQISSVVVTRTGKTSMTPNYEKC